MTEKYVVHVGMSDDYVRDLLRSRQRLAIDELKGRKIIAIYFDVGLCDHDEFILEVE